MNALVALLLLAQDDAKVKEALNAVAGAMKDASAISFEVDVTMKGQAARSTATVSFKRPNLARLDYKDGLIVLDGKTYWYYSKKDNQYIKEKQDPKTALLLAEPLSPLFFQQTADKLLEKATGLSHLKEKIDDVDYEMVTFKPPEGSDATEWRIWIDGKKMIKRAIMFRPGEEGDPIEQRFEFKSVDLAPKFTDDTFTFTPPKDAIESHDTEEDLQKTLLPEGSAAPEFTVTGLDGKDLKLSDFKGKTVVVVFWFYNCIGCREAMPRAQKLFEEYKDRDVIVLAVNSGDEMDAIKTYVEKGKFTFVTAREKADEVTKAYGVQSYTTNYVIGPDGKIKTRVIGFDIDKIKAALPAKK